MDPDPDPGGPKTCGFQHWNYPERKSGIGHQIFRFDHLAAGLLCLVDEDVDLVGENVDLLLNLLLLVRGHTCNTESRGISLQVDLDTDPVDPYQIGWPPGSEFGSVNSTLRIQILTVGTYYLSKIKRNLRKKGSIFYNFYYYFFSLVTENNDNQLSHGVSL
jgi:hypothetical protein